jgi:hypothetical protein
LLRGYGYNDAEIDRFIADGVVEAADVTTLPTTDRPLHDGPAN